MSTISPNTLCKIQEQLNNGKSLWSMDLSLDTTRMNDELMMD